MFNNTPTLAGCPRVGRCSGILGLRRDLRNTISALIPTSRLLAGLTARAHNYTVSERHKIVVGKQLSVTSLISCRKLLPKFKGTRSLAQGFQVYITEHLRSSASHETIIFSPQTIITLVQHLLAQKDPKLKIELELHIGAKNNMLVI